MNVVVCVDENKRLQKLLADIRDHRLTQVLLPLNQIRKTPAVHVLQEHLG